MMEERNARRFALDREEAARLTAGTRDRGMGAAALGAVRREAEAMAKLLIADSQAGVAPVPADESPESAPQETLRPIQPPFRRRAALRQALRR